MKRKILIFSLRLFGILAFVMWCYFVGDYLNIRGMQYNIVSTDNVILKFMMGLLSHFIAFLVFATIGTMLYNLWPEDISEDTIHKFEEARQKKQKEIEKRELEQPDYDPLQLVKSKYESNNL